MHMTRFEAEAILRAAASGAIPAPGDVLLRVQDGWVFASLDGTTGGGGGGVPTTLPFNKITGFIANSQVPASAVNQYIEHKEVELNWGADLFQRFKRFTVVDAAVTVAKQVSMWHSLVAPSGKTEDEGEMDTFLCRCVPGAGSFDVYIDSLFGSVVGPFKYNYLVG